MQLQKWSVDAPPNNIVVVSEALGCDYTAGMSALSAGGRTVVVAGWEVDVTYPTTSLDLFEAAREGRGSSYIFR